MSHWCVSFIHSPPPGWNPPFPAFSSIFVPPELSWYQMYDGSQSNCNAELPLYFLRRFLHHKWISEMTFHWEGVLIIVWLATEVSLPQSSVFMWFAQNLVLSPSEGVYYTLCEVLCKLLIANHVRLSNAQAGADTLQPLVYIWPTACTFVFGQGHAQLFIIYCLYLFSCYNSRVAQL